MPFSGPIPLGLADPESAGLGQRLSQYLTQSRQPAPTGPLVQGDWQPIQGVMPALPGKLPAAGTNQIQNSPMSIGNLGGSVPGESITAALSFGGISGPAGNSGFQGPSGAQDPIPAIQAPLVPPETQALNTTFTGGATGGEGGGQPLNIGGPAQSRSSGSSSQESVPSAPGSHARPPGDEAAWQSYRAGERASYPTGGAGTFTAGEYTPDPAAYRTYGYTDATAGTQGEFTSAPGALQSPGELMSVGAPSGIYDSEFPGQIGSEAVVATDAGGTGLANLGDNLATFGPVLAAAAAAVQGDYQGAGAAALPAAVLTWGPKLAAALGVQGSTLASGAAATAGATAAEGLTGLAGGAAAMAPAAIFAAPMLLKGAVDFFNASGDAKRLERYTEKGEAATPVRDAFFDAVAKGDLDRVVIPASADGRQGAITAGQMLYATANQYAGWAGQQGLARTDGAGQGMAVDPNLVNVLPILDDLRARGYALDQPFLVNPDAGEHQLWLNEFMQSYRTPSPHTAVNDPTHRSNWSDFFGAAGAAPMSESERYAIFDALQGLDSVVANAAMNPYYAGYQASRQQADVPPIQRGPGPTWVDF